MFPRSDRKLSIVLLGVFVVMTLTGVVFYRHTAAVREAVERDRREQQAITTLDRTVSMIEDIEAGTREFIETSSADHLEPVNRARQQIGPNLEWLKLALAGREDLIADLRKIEAGYAQLDASSRRRVELRRTRGFDEAFYFQPGFSEQKVLDDVRRAANRISAAEFNILEQRARALDNDFSWTIWTLILGSVAGFAALLVANFTISREIARRRLAENVLRDANRDLEARIEERTAEIRSANRRLLESATEREDLLASETSARREAEIANRLRDEFLATVSHELRTPINSILGWARLMKKGKLDPERTTAAVDTIIKNSEAQNRLIQDLMDVARIVSGKLELEFEPLCPKELVELSVDTVRPSADQSLIAVGLDLSNLKGTEVVSGDRTRLLQVFSNLLTNAIKFTPEGGRIDVTALRQGDTVAVEIADTGKGISPDFLPLVFERFRQDTEAARSKGGLGLGLAIVRNLVEMHGGNVSVSSEGENKGSTFTVVLPLAGNGAG